MLLTLLISDYAASRGIAGSSADQLVYAVRSFERFLNRPASVDDLSRETVNAFLNDLSHDKTIKPRTAKGKRDALLSLWRHGRDLGLIDTVPTLIRPVKVPDKVPQAWTKEQTAALVESAWRLDRTRYLPNGVQYRLFFKSLFELAYYTGFPRADLSTLRTDEMSKHGASVAIAHIRQKTAAVMVASCPDDCYADFFAISHRIRRDGHDGWETPLAWPLSWRMLYIWIDRIKLAAGVATDGALHQLRRSGATHVLKDGRDPSHYLNHADPRLARKHYVDRLQLGDSVMPTRLEFPDRQA